MAVNEFEYDYIVVGGGSAGSVVATLLAENPNYRVLLVDAGKSPDSIPDVWNPYDNNNLYGMADNWWQGYETPRYAGSDKTMGVGRSKLFGGCSAVNDMVYTRGAPADFNRWANFYGCIGWSYSDVESNFKAVEVIIKPSTGSKDEFGSAFIAACNGLGIPYVDNYNSDVPLNGVSPLCSTISSKTIRETSFNSYVQGEVSNLTLIGGALVSKVLIENSEATGSFAQPIAKGIEYIASDGSPHTVRCNNEVILSAGSINSPKILMSSGVGNRAELEAMGIEVFADSPLVGQNLQSAVIFQLSWTTSQPLTLPPPAENGNRRNEGYAITWTNMNRHEQPKTCIEMMPGLYSANQPISDLENNYSITGGAMRLLSRGWVKLASTDPNTPPEINLNLFADSRDLDECVESFKIARDIGNAPELSSLRGMETTPGSDVTTDNEIKQWILNSFNSYSHPSGTCKMGPDASDAVVDTTLKVHGIQNLRVMDASIMPEITSGHTQAPSFMIGHKGASFILNGE